MSTDTKVGFYAPPSPTRQVFSPWVRDELGNLSREIQAIEIEGANHPRALLDKLRGKLAATESVIELRRILASARSLAERVPDVDLHKDIVGLIERCGAKLTRAQAP